MASALGLTMSRTTPLLLFSCFCLLAGDMLYGYDTISFGGMLANPGFIARFAPYHAAAKTHVFDSLHTSLLSSMPFIGKFIGCFLAGPAIERVGHRMVFWLLSAVSIIGVLIEITSASGNQGRYAQFLVGRIIVYASIGMVEVNITTYQAEIVPAPLRGLVVVSMQLFLTAGGVIATGINKAFANTHTDAGWQTVTGIQFLFPFLIATFTYFIPNSPRWLLSKDREDEATTALRRLRSPDEVAAGNCEAEISAIKEALQENMHKGSWRALVQGTNLRRTALVIVYYFFQQTTGQAFVSTYQTTFYKTNGFAAEAFTYPIITTCLGMLAVVPAMYLVDTLGRRATLLQSYVFQALWLFILAGLGSKTVRTATQDNAIVASFMLFAVFYNLGSASIPYLLGAEIPNAALREKTQAIGASWNVVWAFVTNFIIPYMINSIHFKVGWVFGGISALALVFTFFFLPETKALALEEIDALFSVSFNPFIKTDIPLTTVQRRIGYFEGEDDKDATKFVETA